MRPTVVANKVRLRNVSCGYEFLAQPKEELKRKNAHILATAVILKMSNSEPWLRRTEGPVIKRGGLLLCPKPPSCQSKPPGRGGREPSLYFYTLENASDNHVEGHCHLISAGKQEVAATVQGDCLWTQRNPSVSSAWIFKWLWYSLTLNPLYDPVSLIELRKKFNMLTCSRHFLHTTWGFGGNLAAGFKIQGERRKEGGRKKEMPVFNLLSLS